MKLRPYLLAFALFGLVIFGLVNFSYLKDQQGIFRGIDSKIIVGLIAASVVQIIGHYFRTLRTKQVIDQVKKGDTRGQFEALATGYLYNMLFPFRIGEIVRALLISVRLDISFLYTFVAIIIERSVDLIFLSILALTLIFALHTGPMSVVFFAAIGAILLSVAMIVAIILLARENKRILKLIWIMSAWFNIRLRNQIRFKVWSLIYGLQRFLSNKKTVQKYTVLTIVSWASYLLSTFIIVVVILPTSSFVNTSLASSSPYLAASAPASTSASAYDSTLTPALEKSYKQPALGQYVYATWLLLAIPMSIIGLVSITLRNDKLRRRNRGVSNETSYNNKLLRSDDLSQEFPAFLENYFAGNKLARALHKLETSGEVSLVKFFKGGSDAITILVLQKGELIVKKIIPHEYEDRLRAQYLWLQKFKQLRYLVKTKGEQRNDDYYAIDLDYSSENIPFFEFLHQKKIKDSLEVLDHTWEYLYENIHKNAKKAAYYPKLRDQFVEKHIFGCVEKAEAVDEELRTVRALKSIVVNGHAYDNLDVVMKKIRANKQAWRDIATFQKGEYVHGDMAIDNILVSPNDHKPLIIDPAPDGNILEGPVFDLGKLSQSFYCGYEFLLRDDSPTHVNAKNQINYQEQRTTQYEKMWNHLRNELAPRYVGESEQRALLFHAATLHLRRLKHQVNYNPENVLKFYAVGVKTLNDFLSQYE